MLFGAVGSYCMYRYLISGQLKFGVLALGMLMVLPGIFLNPVNWRSPAATAVRDSSNKLKALSIIGAILIVVGSLMLWR